MSNLNSNLLPKKFNLIFGDNNCKNSNNIYVYSKPSTDESKEERNNNLPLSISSVSLDDTIKNQVKNSKRCLVFELLHRIKAPYDIRHMYVCNKPGNFDPRFSRITPIIDNNSCISSYALEKLKNMYDLDSPTEIEDFNASIKAYEEYYKSRGKIETELYHKFSEITYGMEYADFFEIVPVLKGMNKDPDLYLFMVSYHLHNPRHQIDLEKPIIQDVWKLINEYKMIKKTYKIGGKMVDF